MLLHRAYPEFGELIELLEKTYKKIPADGGDFLFDSGWISA